MPESVSLELGGRNYSIQVGKVAKQASGATWIQYGETVILTAAVASKNPIDKDFFPLSVQYREKTYAAGKIPGGFFKREGRPTEKEILSSRLIDRPLRPLFPDGFRNEIQISATVLSSDQANDSDILGITGASAALMVSDIPFPEPVSGVRVGQIEGKLVLNPTFQELEQSALDMVVAGTDSSTGRVEGGAREVSEAVVVDALRFAHQHIIELNKLQIELRRRVGKPKREFVVPQKDASLEAAVEREFGGRIRKANEIQTKEERQGELDRIKEEALAKFEESHPEMGKQIASILEHIESQDLRRRILKDGKRADGRAPDDIREITCEIGVLPRTHGSALFTRGQTQSLVATTLGTKVDEQRVEELEGQSWKSYMLHYNFPPFSVGEVRPMRGPGRREIGHGALAERAIEPLIPSDIDFPYTIRIVSDILESNGSSSMATVCGGSLSLMDAGVPIKSHVAGIAMGLIQEGKDVAILTDILGSGEVRIAAFSGADGDRAREIIRSITEGPEIGRIYSGTVRRVVPFGAFVEISPGKDGLVHISELEPHRVERVEDVINEGDTVLVKVIGIDREGKIKLSRKQALPGYVDTGEPAAAGGGSRGGGGGGDRPERRPEHARR